MKAPCFLGTRFGDALNFALEVHGGDLRKGNSTPYFAHLLGVCSLVLQHGGTEDEAIGALLHDTLEDHPEKVTNMLLAEKFGRGVEGIVRSCTDTPPNYEGGPKPPWRERKLAYFAHLAGASPSARLVALADKLYNLRELVADLRSDGDSVWARFNAGREDQIWFYSETVRTMKRSGIRSPMLTDLQSAFSDLQKLSGRESKASTQ